MPLTNSVIRRYTPPTCTLEVLAQSSPLSRLLGKTVLKQLTFELRFDDPQLPVERRFQIRGDRDQLEALCDAVTTYVQEILQQSPESFWFSFSGLQDSTKVSQDTELTDFQQAPLLAKTSKSFTAPIPGTKIYLESNSYLTHNLYLGSLANPDSGSVIQLSLLQLFDLATALDEYAADVMTLPTLNESSSVVRLPNWVPIAAMLVIAVGLTPLTWQYASNTRQKQQQTAKTTTPQEESVALQPAPSPNFPVPQTQLTPPYNVSSLPLGSTPQVPPNSNFPTTTLTSPDQNLTSNPELAPNSVASTQTANLPPTQIPPLSGNSSSNIPGQQIAIQPNPIGTNNSAESALPIRRNLPPRLSSTPAPVPPPLATLPNASGNNTIPQTYSPVNSQQSQARLNSAATTPSEVADANSLIARLRGESNTTPTEVSVNSSSTLFDTPQVVEAREFLQRRWQPPTGFTQTLEYSLILGVDGSIERILPLGKSARDHFDAVGMPAIGAPFVSANRYGQNTRIRVLLSPDGRVQTFPERD
ncbi:hypothetical protein Nos7524_4070 [Nostoc sp. PCC 7524]|uniref:DUF4335 domain-containing protein n=1 Tax=Nostoc sp. (strain ATCC 29411 / PCC 7524) TaxID=28072 RepID=UPI00029F1415|nr:DUF4335 domain-containing protein [Nostoc sp. PCC 7524]AFY49841.1 hypothetical protein Nos7524_4070 [Nostoc sp. PCC 7524]